jgi:uncharacterized integral membrane protein
VLFRSKSTAGSTGRDGKAAASKATGAKAAAATGRAGRRSASAAANATGTTARARLGSIRSRGRAGTRPKAKPEPSIAEPTVTATDDVMAASNAQRALSPDMSRVAWLRTQLQKLEAHRRERLTKVLQLTLIAIVFITFVLQNADTVNVQFLVFSVNLRLIWIIFGCALLGGAAGYLIARPEKSLRSLLPPKEQKPTGAPVR